MGVTVTVARSAGCSRCPRGGRSAAIVRSRVRWPPLRSRRRFLCDHAIASGCSRARRSPRASSLAACRALSAASVRSRARQLPSRPLRRLLCAQAHGGCYAATVIAVSVLSLARPHAARRGGRHGRSARTGGCCQCAAPTVRRPPPQLSREATCDHYLSRVCRCPTLVSRGNGATPSHASSLTHTNKTFIDARCRRAAVNGTVKGLWSVEKSAGAPSNARS